MANFIEYAAKAQEELNIELQKLAQKELKLAEQASLQATAAIELEKRQAAVVESEHALDLQREELTILKYGLRRVKMAVIRWWQKTVRFQKKAEAVNPMLWRLRKIPQSKEQWKQE